MAFDDERLILAVICHDSEPGRLMANQMQRDQSFAADDRFRWTLDTFLTARGGYFDEISPAGAMGDGLHELQANTQLSPWISIGNNRPGNDLYFVYTHNWERLLDPTGVEHRFATLDRRMASKLFYTLHF